MIEKIPIFYGQKVLLHNKCKTKVQWPLVLSPGSNINSSHVNISHGYKREKCVIFLYEDTGISSGKAIYGKGEDLRKLSPIPGTLDARRVIIHTLLLGLSEQHQLLLFCSHTRLTRVSHGREFQDSCGCCPS